MVDITNILRAAFSYKRFTRSFLYLHFRFVLPWHKNIGAKGAQKNVCKIDTRLGSLCFARIGFLFYHDFETSQVHLMGKKSSLAIEMIDPDRRL